MFSDTVDALTAARWTVVLLLPLLLKVTVVDAETNR